MYHSWCSAEECMHGGAIVSHLSYFLEIDLCVFKVTYELMHSHDNHGLLYWRYHAVYLCCLWKVYIHADRFKKLQISM